MCVLVGLCVCVCEFQREPSTRGKQWIFPEGGKTTADLYFPSPSLLAHRLQHITFIGLEQLLTVKKALAQKNPETWTPPSALSAATHIAGGSRPLADAKELMTKQQ